jgi:pimeloyl-ACP methyl ester carboxylesterase
MGRLVFEKDVHQHRWIAAMQHSTIPMCFINGPADPNSGIHMAKRYSELIPNANVVLLNENIGHWPQIEAPDEVLITFYKFQKSLTM